MPSSSSAIAERRRSGVRRTSPSAALPFHDSVVLVIGEFGPAELAGFFGTQVWNGVTSQYADTSGAVPTGPILWDMLRDALPTNNRRGSLDGVLRDRTRIRRSHVPRPLQFSDEEYSDAEDREFERDLYFVLDAFDVWGVIAAGTAHKTDTLRGKLQAVDVPFLVTTDSTSRSLEAAQKTELRLVPSNRAQARAMLLKAARHDTSDRIPFVRDPDENAQAYADDLSDQLQTEGARLNLDAYDITEEDHDIESIPGPLLVVAYRAFGSSVALARGRHRLTILSDGCAQLDPETLRTSDGVSIAELVHVARPDVTPDYLGRRAFDALHKARLWISRWTTARVPWEPDRRHQSVYIRRQAHVDLVRRYLEADHPRRFRFEGLQRIENVAPTYKIQPLAGSGR
jgi:hypothetical protein